MPRMNLQRSITAFILVLLFIIHWWFIFYIVNIRQHSNYRSTRVVQLNKIKIITILQYRNRKYDLMEVYVAFAII